MVIIGEKEIDRQTLSIREHGGNNLGMMDEQKLISLIESRIMTELNK